MTRRVEPELLDEMPPDEPCARQSRRDLVRLNAWMGHSRLMAQALRSAGHNGKPRRIVELGAGDGRFLLRVARRLSAPWRETTALLLDRQPAVSADTRRRFAAQGWRMKVAKAEVFDWLGRAAPGPWDAVAANLFLHHFREPQLAALLAQSAKRASLFVALEPRRTPLCLTFSRLLWLIGCNRVTRHDAPVSVRAGFAGSELSRLWPADGGWSLEERPAGWCSHLFIATADSRRLSG